MDSSNNFSVIIPTYNSAKYIKNTLISVVNQTYLNYEIIVIDDGSNDNTVEIISNFFKNLNNISFKLLEQKNSGAGSARNNGINNAKYDWIAFLDSDDLWNFNKLSVINDFLNKNKNYNFLCHNEYINELDGTQLINNYSKNFNFTKDLVSQLYEKNYFSTSAIVVKKAILLKHKGFNIFLRSAQDYEMWLRMSPDLNVKFIDKVLGTYIMRSGNISTSNYWKRLWNILRIKLIHRKKVSFFIFVKNIFLSVILHILIPILKKIKFI